MLAIEIDDVLYDGFTSLSVTKSIEQLSGTFTCTFANVFKSVFPVKENSRVRILNENNDCLLDGYVDVVSVNYSDNSHDIVVRGRDKTADIIDSTIKDNTGFTAPISIVTVIQETIKKIGIDIPVVNNAGNISDFLQDELVVAEVGKNMFEFLEEHCKQRQVLLSTDGNGNIVLYRGGNQERIPAAIVNEIDGQNNNVMSASVEYNYANRFNTYNVKSQGNPVSGTEDDTLESKSGVAQDTAIRSTRYLEMSADKLSQKMTAEGHAKWEANIRRSRSFTYNVLLSGHTYDGRNFWDINKIVHVKDVFSFVDADLLIKDITFNYDVDAGSTTSMTLVDKDSFTPEPEQSQEDADVNKTFTNNPPILSISGSGGSF